MPDFIKKVIFGDENVLPEDVPCVEQLCFFDPDRHFDTSASHMSAVFTHMPADIAIKNTLCNNESFRLSRGLSFNGLCRAKGARNMWFEG